MKDISLMNKQMQKKLEKTHKSHACYTQQNAELKALFRANFPRDTLITIQNVIEVGGYDKDKEKMKSFFDKVNTENYDDNDIEGFKLLIKPYTQAIINALKEKAQEAKNSIQ